MIAFEVYLNDQFLCRAGLGGRHTITANLHILPESLGGKTSLQVSGNQMDSVQFPKKPEQGNISQEKFLALAQEILDGGSTNWVNEKLTEDFKLDIRIVEVETDQISQGETVFVDLEKYQDVIMNSFGKLFPKEKE